MMDLNLVLFSIIGLSAKRLLWRNTFIYVEHQNSCKK